MNDIFISKLQISHGHWKSEVVNDFMKLKTSTLYNELHEGNFMLVNSKKYNKKQDVER